MPLRSHGIVPAYALLLATVAGCTAPVNLPRARTIPATLAPSSSGTASLPLESIPIPSGTFFTVPYLQLGANGTDTSSLAVVWHVHGTANAVYGTTRAAEWRVETRSPAGTSTWQRQTAAVQMNPVIASGIAAHTVCTAPLAGLSPGAPFDYRILEKEKPVFAARANRARPPANGDFHLVVFGDCAENTAWQKKVAYQTYLKKPDAVLITGDIVYPEGRASEYRDHFFPVYNADMPDPTAGAPLLRSTLFIGVSGNHDLDYANLAKHPDALAYYYYWKQPLNGWGSERGKADHPPVTGSTAAFQEAVGAEYPHGANYFFDYGSAHFTVIDANYYMNWNDPSLVAGLKKAITANPAATWRFVVFHVAPFHSSKTHQNEQWMRVLAPVFEECGVDVVWSGHVHNYQRTYPLRFAPQGGRTATGKVPGTFTLDKTYDGHIQTKANGVLYVVTGAGGAALYPQAYHDADEGGSDSATLQEYTAKYIADIHSLTDVSVQGKTLTVHQIDENGKAIDTWTVTK